MALLPYVDESKASEKTREILNRGKVKMNVARMIANSDAAFYPFSMLGNSLLTRSKLDAKLRDKSLEQERRDALTALRGKLDAMTDMEILAL